MITTIREPDRLANLDFAKHNAEMQKVWQAFNAGQPVRTPVIVGTNSRYFLFNRAANPGGVSFKEYSENPDLMFDTQLQFQRWSGHNILQDAELGLPKRWQPSPDFQNYYEAAWFGCPIARLDGMKASLVVLELHNSNLNYVTPSDALAASPYGYFRVIHCRRGSGPIFPNLIKWPAQKTVRLKANTTYVGQTHKKPAK